MVIELILDELLCPYEGNWDTQPLGLCCSTSLLNPLTALLYIHLLFILLLFQAYTVNYTICAPPLYFYMMYTTGIIPVQRYIHCTVLHCTEYIYTVQYYTVQSIFTLYRWYNTGTCKCVITHMVEVDTLGLRLHVLL